MSSEATLKEGGNVALGRALRRLVVIVPGLGGNAKSWEALTDQLKLEPELKNANWMPFDHGSKWYSCGCMKDLGMELNAQIAGYCTQRGSFDEIFLIAHSMGGLIVRDAYLQCSAAKVSGLAYSWADRVVRFLLFASLNRGIEVSNSTVIRRAISSFRRALPFVKHLRVIDLYRGSSYLTNLRVDWVRRFGELHAADSAGLQRGNLPKPPVIVQLLGTSDGWVKSDDNKDVLAFPSGHYRYIAFADHATIFRTDLAPDPQLRYAVIRDALLGDFVPHQVHAENLAVKRVVFLLHGIRASSVDKWISDLKVRILERDSKTIVVTPDYGYFRAIQFALPSVRKRNIRDFQDWYVEALAAYPAAEFNAIAHSNGTYLLGHSLLKTSGMYFKHVALAGSVLPRNFLEKLVRPDGKKQVSLLRNDRANRDWPVALLCSALNGLRMRDIGTAGFAGFTGAYSDEVAYHRGGHGQALNPLHLDTLVDFVLEGKSSRSPQLVDKPGYYRQLSNAMPYVACVTVVMAIWFAIAYIFSNGTFDVRHALYVALALVGVYFLLDIL